MSSISKSPLNNNMISFESSEESSWTKYFEDFFNNDHNNIDGDDHDGGSSTSSLVFDAAEKKLSDHSAQGAMEYNKRLSFKKRKKIKTSLVDHDLEDTASSPINSPKIFKAKEKEEIDQFYEEKGNTQREKEVEFNERDTSNNEHSELNKKGFCLVPMSMVINYI
ncbi:vascular-related unknown protein 4 [Lathyrus oleraceus]|uniref:Uncharacterized protein n=1 Tax=Pisum sativum TaxID=3888 RepID=A0A9D4WZY3_PEA|nr:vascular-related unknown protein 4-like [Pisum sativum]KAI5412213.1 hypothetical protein KIW84_057042 [Pisum sativum]